jgi:hypothetical protein
MKGGRGTRVACPAVLRAERRRGGGQRPRGTGTCSAAATRTLPISIAERGLAALVDRGRRRRFGDAAGADATRADEEAASCARDLRVHALEVRPPLALRLVVGVAHVGANRTVPAADVTCASHGAGWVARHPGSRNARLFASASPGELVDPEENDLRITRCGCGESARSSIRRARGRSAPRCHRAPAPRHCRRSRPAPSPHPSRGRRARGRR